MLAFGCIAPNIKLRNANTRPATRKMPEQLATHQVASQ